MPIFNLGGGTSTASAGFDKVTGHGLVVRSGDQLSAVEMRGIGAIEVRNGGGLEDHPLFIFHGHNLGRARDVDLTVTGDAPIFMKPLWYCITSISIELPTGLPVEAAGGFYTLPNGGGDNLANVTASDLATLNAKYKILDIPISPVANRSARWLYWRGTTANVKTARVNIFVRGRVSIDNDEVEMPV